MLAPGGLMSKSMRKIEPLAAPPEQSRATASLLVVTCPRRCRSVSRGEPAQVAQAGAGGDPPRSAEFRRDEARSSSLRGTLTAAHRRIASHRPSSPPAGADRSGPQRQAQRRLPAGAARDHVWRHARLAPAPGGHVHDSPMTCARRVRRHVRPHRHKGQDRRLPERGPARRAAQVRAQERGEGGCRGGGGGGGGRRRFSRPPAVWSGTPKSPKSSRCTSRPPTLTTSRPAPTRPTSRTLISPRVVRCA